MGVLHAYILGCNWKPERIQVVGPGSHMATLPDSSPLKMVAPVEFWRFLLESPPFLGASC